MFIGLLTKRHLLLRCINSREADFELCIRGIKDGDCIAISNGNNATY